MGAADSRGGRAGSGRRIRPNDTAETTYETASTKMANGAPITCTSAPARPGPPISASDVLAASLLLPSMTRSTPMSDGTYAGYAALNSESRQPIKEHNDVDLLYSKHAGEVGRRNGEEQHRPRGIGRDQQGLAAQPIHPRAGKETNEQDARL